MLIRSASRRHSIALVRLVETRLCAIRPSAIVSTTILLVLVHVCSIVGARIIGVPIGVVTGLGLLRVARLLLRLCALASSLLLSLGSWVGSVMATSFTAGSRVARWGLLSCALWELRRALRLRTIISTERSLLS